MDAAFTAEQDEIRRALRTALARPRPATRQPVPPGAAGAAGAAPEPGSGTGHDPGLWAALARQLGLPGLALPERYGGVGCGPVELALACEESGRALLPSPLLATAVLAAPLLLALGTEGQRAVLLPQIADGSSTAALVVPGASLATALGLTGGNRGDWAGGGRAGGVQASSGGGSWRLYGQAAQVLDGHSADLLLVAAHTGGFARPRTRLFLVRADAAGLVRVRQTAVDATRPQARVELRDVPAELLGEDEGEGEDDTGSGGHQEPAPGTDDAGPGTDDAGRGDEVPAALAAAGDVAAALLAAEAVGAADRALERTVAYVREREQFGRAIGSFQAVKHRLADVYVQVEAARSAAYYAAWAVGAQAAPPPDAEAVGALALAQALEALRTAAAEAVQLHGGIGFTWEHDAHLYLKRAAGDELLFGPVHRLRARAAERSGLFATTGGATGSATGGATGRATGAVAV